MLRPITNTLMLCMMLSCWEISGKGDDNDISPLVQESINQPPNEMKNGTPRSVLSSGGNSSKQVGCGEYGQDPGQYDHPGQLEDRCSQPEEAMNVQILSIKASGNGCQKGSVGVNLSPDAKAFTLVFSEYFVELADAESQDVNKSCQLELSLKIPFGLRFRVSRIDFRGYLSLDSAVIGSLSSGYRFLQSPDSLFYFNHTFNGPADNAFFVQDLALEQDPFWSPCGAGEPITLKIDSKIRLSNNETDGLGLLSLDSADGDFGQDIHLDWYSCR